MNGLERKQFNYFSALIGMMILLHSVIQQTAPTGYMNLFDYFWNFGRTIVTLPLFAGGEALTRAIPFWLPRWMEVLAALGLALSITRRAAGGLLALASLYICIFNYPAFGVGEPLFALIGIVYLIAPGYDERQRARAGDLLIGLFTAMYVFSAIAKMNSEFLSGRLITEEISYIFKPHAWRILIAAQAYSPFAFAGVAIELLAALIFFARTELWGFAAAAVFHAFNAAQINWALSVELLPAAYPLLLWPVRRPRNYFLIIAGAFFGVHAMGLILSFPGAANFVSADTFDLIFSAVPFVLLALIFWLNRARLSGNAPSASPDLRLRFAAFAAVGLITFLCRINSLPAPLGFTQFSGAGSAGSGAAILAVKGDLAGSVYPVFGGRWDLRLFHVEEDTVLFSFPTNAMRDALPPQLCAHDKSLRFLKLDLPGAGIPSPLGTVGRNESAQRGVARFHELARNSFAPCP
jgi:hypothetical protein